MIRLKQVECCATCKSSGGWMDNMLCDLHKIETRPYWICGDYAENEYMASIKVVPLLSYVKDQGKR